MKSLLLISCLLLTGCSLFNRGGAIKGNGLTVQGIPDAGKPATLVTVDAGEVVALPAGSTVTITKTEAVPATKDTPGKPATEVTAITPSGPTVWHKTEKTVNADTGTVDTSIAAKKIDAAESRPLLYAAIVAALAAGFFVWASYPTPAIACGVASAVFFMAWRLSDLPDWFYLIGAAALAGGAALYFGHKRGQANPSE